MSWPINLVRLSEQCRLRLNSQVLRGFKTELWQYKVRRRCFGLLGS